MRIHLRTIIYLSIGIATLILYSSLCSNFSKCGSIEPLLLFICGLFWVGFIVIKFALIFFTDEYDNAELRIPNYYREYKNNRKEKKRARKHNQQVIENLQERIRLADNKELPKLLNLLEQYEKNN